MINIKVLFFANFRELLDCSTINVELSDNSSIKDLCEIMKDNGDRWHSIFSDVKASVKIAVNQEMTVIDYQLKNDDEVAFFPPVTGG